MNHRFLAAALVAGFGGAQAAPPEWVAAKVVRVEPERSRVTLDHKRIQSIGMAPMVMPFKVAETVSLKPFKAGDKVRFRVASQDDHLVVEAMEKVQ
jgi:Cu/Ag efflux protein CusF